MTQQDVGSEGGSIEDGLTFGGGVAMHVDSDESGPEEDCPYEFDPYADATDDECDDEENVQVGQTNAPSQQVIKEFKAYVRAAHQHQVQLKPKEVTAIKIMHILYRKKATLDTYDEVMEWHFLERGWLHEGQPLGQLKHFASRKTIMKKLKKRYNMGKKYATPVQRILPHTKAKVNVYR